MGTETKIFKFKISSNKKITKQFITKINNQQILTKTIVGPTKNRINRLKVLLASSLLENDLKKNPKQVNFVGPFLFLICTLVYL
jgi:hypothetical protein